MSDLSTLIDAAWDEKDEDTPNVPEMAVVEDTPDTPDAPNAQATATNEADVAASTEEATPGLTVDERGRYHRPDGTIASREEVETFKAGQGGRGERDTQGEAQAPITGAAEVPPAPAATPFRYRAIGQTHVVEGSKVDDKGGIYFPAERVTELQRLLAGGQQFYSEGHGSFQYVQQLERQLTEAKETKTVEREKADRVLGMVEQWSKMDRVEALTAFNDFLDQHPSLMAKAEAEYWKQQATKGAQQPTKAQPDMAEPQAEAAPTQYPTREAMGQTHGEYIEQAKLLPEFRELTEADWTQLAQRTSRRMPAYFRPLTAEEATTYGAQPGQFVYDTDVLIEDVTDFLAQVKRERDTAARIAAASKAAAFNSAQTKGTAQAPAARTARPSTPAPQPTSNVSPRKQLRAVIDDAWAGIDDE